MNGRAAPQFHDVTSRVSCARAASAAAPLVAAVDDEMTPASTYARFAPYVRRRLADFGVREADLPDLCQEVFLVVQGKRDALSTIDRTDL